MPSATTLLRSISSDNRIIAAISEQIHSGQITAGSQLSIRIYKPTDLGVVVAAVEIVELCLGVVVISAVTEGVLLSKGIGHVAGYRQHLAPCVIGIENLRHEVAVLIYAVKTYNVALRVVGVVVDGSVGHGDGYPCAIGVIIEPQYITAGLLMFHYYLLIFIKFDTFASYSNYIS